MVTPGPCGHCKNLAILPAIRACAVVYHDPEPVVYHDPEPVVYHEPEPEVYYEPAPTLVRRCHEVPTSCSCRMGTRQVCTKRKVQVKVRT